jgi:hypothetical protein
VKYKVNFAQTRWITVHVEAEDEEAALEDAYDHLPGISAHETGWDSFGVWSSDYDDAMPVDEFLQVWKGKYDPRIDGEVVEIDED